MSNIFPASVFDAAAKPELITGSGLFQNALQTEAADASASISTAYSIAVGDQFDGYLSASDHDWVAVSLTAGQSYVFTAWGRGGSAAGIDDTVLSLRNPAGTVLATNDDVSTSYFSRVSFTASSTGTYYLDVSAYGSETGTYTVQAATNVYTVDQVVTQITEFGWGLPAVLTLVEDASNAIQVNLTALNAAGQQLAHWALDAWSLVSGLTFTATSSSSADIIFDDNMSGAFAGATAYNPDTGDVIQASVNVSSNWLLAYGTTLDSYSFLTYLHEIGHALGLAHAGSYDGTGSYPADADYLNDSYQMTVMSYFSNAENTYVNGSAGNPVTPMIADILAIQALYGTPSSIYGGNTVWGAGSNVGGYLGTLFSYVFDGAAVNPAIYAGGPLILTIVDTGGIDTINLSTMTSSNMVDLRQEAVSNVGGYFGNMVIARGTVIENLIGGLANDRLIGNSSANRITGGAGDDTINGGGGIDTAVINVRHTAAVITETDAGFQVVSALGTDQYISIEQIAFADGTFSVADLLASGAAPTVTVGTTGNDTITGDDGKDSITGGDGNDVLDGAGGDDTLFGDAGRDALLGRAGRDEIHGGDGNDTISGGDDNDLIYGDAGVDSIGGGDGNDTIYGGSDRDIIGGGNGDDLAEGQDGNDQLSGGYGADTLRGGAGDDMIAGSFGNDLIEGGVGNDNLGGGRGRDTIYGGAGNDTIGGGEEDDVLFGDAGNDFMAGSSGNDSFDGGIGRDTLNGGDGNDTLTGGAGADVFVFTALNDGEIDTITDFSVSDGDLIRILGVAGSGQQGKFDALDLTVSGADLDVTYDGHTIHLLGVSISDLDRMDFLFT
jgi:serralysin